MVNETMLWNKITGYFTLIWHDVAGSVNLDAMVLAIPTLAELTGILGDPSKRPLAALFLANDRVQSPYYLIRKASFLTMGYM